MKDFTIKHGWEKPEKKKFYNKEWEEVQRTKCQIYSRVMWYYGAVSQYNHGKKSEFYSRTCFDYKKFLQ